MIGRTECRSSSCHNALGIRSQNSGIETQSRATHVEFDLQKRHGCDPKTATSSYPSSAARCLRGPTGVSDDPTPTTAEGRITPLLGQSNPRKNCRAERVEFEAGYVFVYCLEASRVDDRGKRLFLFKNFLHFQIELSALRSINRLLGFLKQVVERFVAPIRVLQCS